MTMQDHTLPWQLNNFCNISSESVGAPAYSPNLAHSNYHLSSALKEHLGDHRLQRNEKVETPVKQWVSGKGTGIY
jgi:hypothetical protein